MGWLFAVALGLQEQKRAAVLRALTADCAGARAFDWDHRRRGPSGPCCRALSHSENCCCRDPFCIRFISSTAFASSELGGDASRLRRFDALVVCHGFSARRGIDARPVFSAIADCGSSRITTTLTKCMRGHSRILARLLCSSAAVVVHTLGYLLTTALVAIVVYEKLGVAILRHAWFNIDFVWMLALMITGVFILVF